MRVSSWGRGEGVVLIAEVLAEQGRGWKWGAPRAPFRGGGGSSPPVSHSVWRLFLYGALDSRPFCPSHIASGRCFLSAAAAGAPAGVVSAFAGPSGWCAGAVLDVAGCAGCASAAPSSWRIRVVLVVAGVVWLFLLSTHLRPQAVHNPSLWIRVREAQVPCSGTRCPGRPPHTWVARAQGAFLAGFG